MACRLHNTHSPPPPPPHPVPRGAQLSHIAAALLDIYAPVIVGFCVTIAQPDALKGSLVATLKEVRPTIFFGVPRVFEKIQERMQEVGRRSGCCAQGIARWAKRIGREATRAEEAGAPLPWGHALANGLVYANIRRALGLDQCRALISAAAPMLPETLEYFASLHLPVHEAYGMSETCGPVTACLPGSRRPGTCGKSFSGMEVAIFPVRDPERVAELAAAAAAAASAGAAGAGSTPTAAPEPEPVALSAGTEGEVCMRGRHIMVGYKDDEANSAATIDRHGWLHSGDLGVIDADGYLRITGRAKELIKTAGGEFVPPLLIENVIKEEMKAVSCPVVVGDRRKYVTALLALRCRVDEAGEPTDELDRLAVETLAAAGCHATTVTAAAVDPAFKAWADAGMARVNRRAISNAQRVQRWRLMPRDVSVAGGELTGTLKLKRAAVLAKYAHLVEAMYTEGGAD
jgi:long-chain-fatty-acid--CoA ligase ACSBG